VSIFFQDEMNVCFPDGQDAGLIWRDRRLMRRILPIICQKRRCRAPNFAIARGLGL
jgi:hypothetical protein